LFFLKNLSWKTNIPPINEAKAILINQRLEVALTNAKSELFPLPIISKIVMVTNALNPNSATATLGIIVKEKNMSDIIINPSQSDSSTSKANKSK